MRKDVVIIGAGAAGLICASTAGRRGRSVLVIDHMRRVANKVRISGGGRCNFTNLSLSSDNYVSRNPRFCKSALARFGPRDVIALIEKHRIRFFEKEAGQLFCSGGSAEIIQMLLEECSDAGVEIHTRCRIAGVKKEDLFIVTTDQGTVQSKSLVVATGGLSYAKLGATDLGYRIALEFGLRVTPQRPALVPLIFTRRDRDRYTELSGISLKARVRSGQTSVDGMILFTHRGLSGPAILQISLYWEEGGPLSIDLLPDMDAYEIFMTRRGSRQRMETVLSRYLPARFAQRWCESCAEPKPINQYTERELRETARKIHHWEIIPKGTEGYATAEVTLGGVDTRELSSKTMEARSVPGLYFVGEVLDVTGQLGGYNLQWAWSSGFAAGQQA